MNSATPRVRIVAWAILLLSLAVVVAANVIPPLLGGEWFRFNSELGLTAWVLASSTLGLILILRAGAVRMGALMLAIGLSGAMATFGASIALTPALASWLIVLPISSIGWVAFLSLTLAGMPLLFPTGSPPSPRWQGLFRLFLGLLVLICLMVAFSDEVFVFCSDVFPNDVACSVWEESGEARGIENCAPVTGPLGLGTECQVAFDNPIGISWVPPLEDSVAGNVLLVGLLSASALAIVSLGVRIRGASRLERLQIKLVFLALGATVAFVLVETMFVELLGAPLPGSELLEFFTWLAIPVSIFLAINRFRLYEIDRLIARTVTYAVVVALLLGTVAAVAAVVGTRFSEPLVVAGTTLAVAALFNPLRRRVQLAVDRRFNRSRYDTERVMDEFAGTLREQLDMGGIAEGWTRVVSDTMQPSTLGIWIRS
jgi:hypothetical protein